MWSQVGGWWGLAAYLTGIASVVYAIKNHIWTWPNNIVSVVLFGYILWVTKYYSNAELQIFYYLPISIYGWYVWQKCGPTRNDDLPITTLSTRHRIQWAAGTATICLVWGYLEARYQKGAFLPYWDAATTVISIVAQYLQTKKRYENWIVWIVVDAIYTFYLFPAQKLMVLATLYGLFMVMGIVGMRQWQKIMREALGSDPLSYPGGRLS